LKQVAATGNQGGGYYLTLQGVHCCNRIRLVNGVYRCLDKAGRLISMAFCSDSRVARMRLSPDLQIVEMEQHFLAVECR